MATKAEIQKAMGNGTVYLISTSEDGKTKVRRSVIGFNRLGELVTERRGFHSPSTWQEESYKEWVIEVPKKMVTMYRYTWKRGDIYEQLNWTSETVDKRFSYPVSVVLTETKEIEVES